MQEPQASPVPGRSSRVAFPVIIRLTHSISIRLLLCTYRTRETQEVPEWFHNLLFSRLFKAPSHLLLAHQSGLRLPQLGHDEAQLGPHVGGVGQELERALERQPRLLEEYAYICTYTRDAGAGGEPHAGICIRRICIYMCSSASPACSRSVVYI